MPRKKKKDVVIEEKPMQSPPEPYTEPRKFRVGQRVKFMFIYGPLEEERCYREGIIFDISTQDAYKSHIYTIATGYDLEVPMTIVPESWIKE